MNDDVRRILHDMELRFSSSNGIPVERAWLKKEDWQILRFFLMQKVQLTGVGDYCTVGPADEQTNQFLLVFDDADRGWTFFSDEDAAMTAFKNAEATGWNCHLFGLVRRTESRAPTRRFYTGDKVMGTGDGIRWIKYCYPEDRYELDNGVQVNARDLFLIERTKH